MCNCSASSNFELVLAGAAESSPYLTWIYNGYKKFRSQLPADVVSEVETQLSTLAI